MDILFLFVGHLGSFAFITSHKWISMDLFWGDFGLKPMDLYI